MADQQIDHRQLHSRARSVVCALQSILQTISEFLGELPFLKWLKRPYQKVIKRIKSSREAKVEEADVRQLSIELREELQGMDVPVEFQSRKDGILRGIDALIESTEEIIQLSATKRFLHLKMVKDIVRRDKLQRESLQNRKDQLGHDATTHRLADLQKTTGMVHANTLKTNENLERVNENIEILKETLDHLVNAITLQATNVST